MSDRLDAALALQAQGINVVAAPRGGKAPLGSWKTWQTERVTERHVRDSFKHGEPNLFIITGSVSELAVLDCDDDDALEYWKTRLGEEILKATARVRTGNGWHFYFKLKKGQVERGRSSQGGDTGKWDIRAEGGGVVAPPSVHKTGRVYAWADDRGPESIQPAPDELFDRSQEGGDDPGGARSMLSHLLTHVPEEGGRNTWLAQVAGHYARHLPYRDAYEHHVRETAEKLKPPLPEHEIDKLIESIWSSEQAKEGRAAPEVGEDDDWRTNLLEPAEESGWLVSGGNRILVQVRVKTEDSWELELASWMDADIRVLGVVEAESGRAYEVEVYKRDGEVVEDALPAATVADPRRLAAWLADRGVSIGTPDGMWPKAMRESARLVRYLEAQDAAPLKAVPALGWHDETEAFICHDGILRSSGRAEFETVRPDPAVRNWAPFVYGHTGEQEAADVLAEVLTFHHETTAAVFGAWWAACLLKPQIGRVASQFPFMALEAASESGKTTGFFSLMLQLSGNNSGQSNPTRAALRDYLSAHRSGIVWVDDLDDLEAHGELLRNVTVGGSIAKKGEGNHEQVVAQMRAALCVSGENLGLHSQKALLDRAVLLEVQSPTDRRSVKDESRPQWDDVLELRDRHPDLTKLAGDVVVLALRQEETVREFKKLRTGAGRFADKGAIVRTGARILQGMIGPEKGSWVVETVDRYVGAQRDLGAENALTMHILPKALAATGWKTRPEGPDPGRKVPATPVFVEGDNGDELMEPTVWFSPSLLAQWWEREPPLNKRIDQRVHSAEAFTQQARALGMGGDLGPGGMRRRFRFVTQDGNTVYWRVPGGLSQELLDRSRGEQDDNGGNNG